MAASGFADPANDAESDALSAKLRSFIPKKEMGVDTFLQKYPQYDGRGAIVAVWDTGIDPGTPGLQKTSDGLPKIVDLIDASGSGDVDMTTTATLSAEGTLPGLSGLVLKMPTGLENPAGVFRLGLKSGGELLDGATKARFAALRKKRWEEKQNEVLAERQRARAKAEAEGSRPSDDTPDSDLTPAQREERTREKLLEEFESNFLSDLPSPLFDCVVWNDGSDWRAIVDTDEDGDLAEEKVLRPFGIAGEYASFIDDVACNFAIQVYEEGENLSIVTNNGSHGTHVAGILAANDPKDPRLNGIAPGARLLSIRLADGRLGGGSTLNGELRAIAACAKYGVDVSNASWGGGSLYQDGTDLSSKVTEKLVKDYGVTAFVSVGNSGPALSTLGSPGGESPWVIGVGAHLSKEMAEVLYSLVGKAGEVPFVFTSRGPAKSGDVGVDVTAPGAALSTTAFSSLSHSSVMQGTSMSSPAAAGVGALLVSAAKAEGIKPTPARMKTALMNGAKFLPEADVFAQGAGMIQAEAAWEHLKAHRDVAALDYWFMASTTTNELLVGPGLMFRRPMPAGPFEATVSVSPEFLSATTNEQKYSVLEPMVLKATAPWITVPPLVGFSSGDRNFKPVIAMPEGWGKESKSPVYGEIQGFLGGREGAGPVLRVPVTLFMPKVLDEASMWKDRYTASTSAGIVHRQYYMVPPQATRAILSVRRTDSEPNARSFEIIAKSLETNRSPGSTESSTFVTMQPNGSSEANLAVSPGRLVEIVLAQSWSSVGDTTLETSVAFEGAYSCTESLSIVGGLPYAELPIRTALSDLSVEVTASLDEAIRVYPPKKSEMVPLGDRDIFPPYRKEDAAVRPFALRRTFEVDVDEPMNVKQGSPNGVDFIGEGVSNGLCIAIHESGERVYMGSLGGQTIKLPKGRTTFTVELRALDRDRLKTFENLPLVLRETMDRGEKLSVFPNAEAAATGKPSSSFSMKRNRDYIALVGGDVRIKAPMKNPPQFYYGSVEVKKGEHTYLSLPLTYTRGPEKPKPESKRKRDRGKKKDPVTVMNEEIVDRRLAALKALRAKRGKNAETSYTLVLQSLQDELADDPRLAMEEAQFEIAKARLFSDAKPKDDEKKEEGDEAEKNGDEAEKKEDGDSAEESPSTAVEVDPKKIAAGERALAALDKGIALIDAKEVAAFFGAKPVPAEGDEEAEKEVSEQEKELGEKRSQLKEMNLLRSRVLLAIGKPKDARAALQETLRWEADANAPSEEIADHQFKLTIEEGNLGQALKLVQEKKLSKDPYSKEWTKKRVELLRKLGWNDWADRVERKEKIRKALGKPLF